MLTRLLVACVTAACWMPNVVLAHHGVDFILVQTAHLPDRGTGYVLARVDYLSEDHDETELEPALLYGATDRMAVELHAHYEKEEGESSRYEAVAPALLFRLTPRDQPFAVGVSAEYEIAHHSDDEDAVEAAAMFGYEAGQWMAVGNVLYHKHSGTSGEWGYAAGFRHTFRQRHGLGIEFVGSFESDGSSEVMVGYYGEFSDRFTFNAGIGTGVDEGPDQSARMAFIWRFK